MRLRLCLVALGAAAALGGCGSLQDTLTGPRIDYKSAGTLPPLEIPPDLTSPARDERYVVPETGRSTATFSGYEAGRRDQARAGDTTVLPQVSEMRIERSGNQRWLVVQQPPEKLWPLVKDFWQENGFLIKVEVPEAGVMETDWAENRAKIPQDFIRETLGKLLEQLYSTAERDKFRTRLERREGGGTEIFLSHRGMVETVQDLTSQRPTEGRGSVWQPRPPDPELEAEFLRRLMVRLGVREEQAKQNLATAAPQQARAIVQTGIGGFEMLEVFEPFDRAWRRVGLALDRVGFTVEDRDRQKGQYFVRYADADSDMKRKDAEKGLLAKLAFWKSDDKGVKAEQYRVHIRQFGGKSVVQVLSKDGKPENSQTTKRIVSLLHEQLR